MPVRLYASRMALSPPTILPSSSGDSVSLRLEEEPGHIKDSHNALCVTHFAVADPGEDPRQGLWHRFDEFVALARRCPGRQASSQVEVDHLVGEAGCGKDRG